MGGSDGELEDGGGVDLTGGGSSSAATEAWSSKLQERMHGTGERMFRRGRGLSGGGEDVRAVDLLQLQRPASREGRRRVCGGGG